MEKIARDHFRTGDYSGLFACIITGRSWDSITKGISTEKYTNKEGLQIKTEASKYLREISIVLNNVPREMLLLLKTNDLLRGLETYFNTRSSSSAFIHMTKCCVRLINSYEREIRRNEMSTFFSNNKNNFSVKNNTIIELFKFYKFNLISYFIEKFNLFKINSYELFLNIFNI